MSKDGMTPQDFLSKVSWEGGVFEALQYGLHEDTLDDSDPDLKENWRELRLAYLDLEGLVQGIEEKMEDYDAFM